MKPEKLVMMHCPSCGADFKKQPIIICKFSGKPDHIEERLPRKCRYCGTNLVRRVMKTKLTFNVGKQLEKPIQTPKQPLA